jgi:hypothetical protein
MRLTGWKRPHTVKAVEVYRECIGLKKSVSAVMGLWSDVDACHMEPCPL